MNRLLTIVGTVLLACAPSCGLFVPGIAGAASTALIVGGKGSYAHLTDEEMSAAFGGYFAGYDTRTSVDFPGSDNFKQSVQVGATNLYGDVYSASATDPDGFITIGGVSEGAPAVTAVLQSLAQNLENPPAGVVVPDPDHLNAAVYGYPSKALRLGTDFQPFPETPYDLLFVFAQYDGVADFPDNPLNFLAVVNAVMGGEQLHVDAANFPILSQPTDWASVTNTLGGTTTTIMIPTPVLPLLVPLQSAGASAETIANLNKLLRPMIDRAYHRPAMTSGVIPTSVLPWPPGYTARAATAGSATAVPAPTRAGRIRAALAATPTISRRAATTDDAAPSTSAVTTEQPRGSEPDTGDAVRESAAASNTGDKAGSATASSRADNGGATTRASRGAGSHSLARKFGHHR